MNDPKEGSDERSYDSPSQLINSTNINEIENKPATLLPVLPLRLLRSSAEQGANAAATQQQKEGSTTLLIDQFFTHTPPQRLNKRNIKDIFLVQTNKPIKLPTLEQLDLPELPILNNQQKALASVALFKAANVKATENAKLY
jgi:hypothetical protein